MDKGTQEWLDAVGIQVEDDYPDQGLVLRGRLVELGQLQPKPPSILRGVLWMLLIEAWLFVVIWGAVEGWKYVGR